MLKSVGLNKIKVGGEIGRRWQISDKIEINMPMEYRIVKGRKHKRSLNALVVKKIKIIDQSSLTFYKFPGCYVG